MTLTFTGSKTGWLYILAGVGVQPAAHAMIFVLPTGGPYETPVR